MGLHYMQQHGNYQKKNRQTNKQTNNKTNDQEHLGKKIIA